jgi:hypothetical protein
VAPHLDGDRYLALDIEAATPLVRGGAFMRFCPGIVALNPRSRPAMGEHPRREVAALTLPMSLRGSLSTRK